MRSVVLRRSGDGDGDGDDDGDDDGARVCLWNSTKVVIIVPSSM